jgi:hypothetical protein
MSIGNRRWSERGGRASGLQGIGEFQVSPSSACF